MDHTELEDGEGIRLIMNAARDYAIILFDLEGKVSTWSHGAESILGYSEKEIIGRSGTRFFTPEDVAAGMDRKLVGYCKVMRDITDRMLAQEALRQSQQYFADLVDSIDGIVWEADAGSQKHTFVSKKAEVILGYSMETWIHEYWTALVYEEDRERARSQWERAFLDKKGYTLDFCPVDTLGRKRWFRDYVSAVEQSDGIVKLRAVLVEKVHQLFKAGERASH